MGISTTTLTPVEQTAFLTLYARALDSRWPSPILGDTLADETVAKIGYDFPGLGVQTSVVCQSALRAKMLDDRVRTFVADHPDAVVVDLGAGLDSGLYRVAPPPSVPLVQRRTARHLRVARRGAAGRCAGALGAGLGGRRRLAGFDTPPSPDHGDRRRTVRISHRSRRSSTSSVASRSTSRPANWRSTITVGSAAFSRAATKVAPQKMFKDVGSQWGYPGFKDAHHPETWNPRLRLVEEASLAHAPEVELFPGWIRVATRLMGKTAAGARKARILRYSF